MAGLLPPAALSAPGITLAASSVGESYVVLDPAFIAPAEDNGTWKAYLVTTKDDLSNASRLDCSTMKKLRNRASRKAGLSPGRRKSVERNSVAGLSSLIGSRQAIILPADGIRTIPQCPLLRLGKKADQFVD